MVCSTALLLLSRNYAASLAAEHNDSLRVTFVEIGQGDAAVIELPGGGVWLVDGGGLPFVRESSPRARQRLAETPARQALLPYLRHRRIEHIDLVVVSHPHPDHYAGLQAVARAIPIAELWSAHMPSAEPGPYERWLQSLESSGTRIVRPRLGTARTSRGAALQVLWPRYAPPDGSKREEARAQSDPILSVNDNSLVVRLDFAGRRVLFTGDIEEEAEDLLVTDDRDALRSDVVKVPHHGSPTSSTQAFVSATSPELAVISCGRANHFGFPDGEVVSRWRGQAGFLLRTDLVGSVTLEVSPDGEMQVETVEAF
jgi:competence protein ComEC